MISRRASTRRVIPAAAEDEVEYPEFDAAYIEHIKDVRFGGLDVLFCPKLFFWNYYKNSDKQFLHFCIVTHNFCVKS